MVVSTCLPESDLAAVELVVRAVRVRNSLTRLGTDRQSRGRIEQLEVATAMESGGLGKRTTPHTLSGAWFTSRTDLLFSDDPNHRAGTRLLNGGEKQALHTLAAAHQRFGHGTGQAERRSWHRFRQRWPVQDWRQNVR